MDIKKIYPEFESWILRIEEKPGPDIIAFNFGLFESEDGYICYLIGATEFDAEDFDWACSEDFIPKNSYFPISASKGEESHNVQTLMERIIKKFVDSPHFQNNFLVNAKAITVGFDDGELERIV